MASARDVLILGGGASGTLLAIQLLRADTDTKVTLIERTGVLGKGIAYGSAHPIHLLNVRAANMSAYPEIPDHFVRWLEANGAEKDGGGGDSFRFATRLAFGNYLTSFLQDLSASTGRLTHIKGEAVALSRTPNGVVVALDNFRRVNGDVAVVATGYEPPAITGMPPNLIPWLRVDQAALKSLDSVLLLGTGLSMVDHVQSLVAARLSGQNPRHLAPRIAAEGASPRRTRGDSRRRGALRRRPHEYFSLVSQAREASGKRGLGLARRPRRAAAVRAGTLAELLARRAIAICETRAALVGCAPASHGTESRGGN